MRDDWAWKNRQANKERARAHTAEVYSKYSDATKIAIQNSRVYDVSDKSHYGEAPCGPIYWPELEYKNTDTMTATKEAIANGEKVCVLNFASYTHPGGMFLEGSMAQEESICHATNLYNVLSTFEDYYSWNGKHKNRGLYTDRAIYSKHILVTDNDIQSIYLPCIDVLTCAAPNLRYFDKWDDEEAVQHIKFIILKRLSFIKRLFMDNDADTFILGAWGCGVFRNDPEMMKQMMLLAFTPCRIEKSIKYIFAVPGDNTPQTRAFENIADEYRIIWNPITEHNPIVYKQDKETVGA